MNNKNLENKLIDEKNNCFIIAEISANHNQNFKYAVDLIKKSADCGVDAVKFQTYTPDTLTINVNNKYFRIKHPKWGKQTLYKLYKKAYTPWSWFEKMKKTADNSGVIFFSTSFDKTSVNFLEGLSVPIHKIASFELVDLPLIEYVAKTGKPLILSTGMATIKEIESAVATAKNAGAEEIILLKCTSSYPADPEQMNLKTILDMKKKFKCVVGFSDHSLGIAASIGAVSLGAKVIEKHFTLSRKIRSPDSFFSIEPDELKNLVKNVRFTEKALGKIYYGLTSDEEKNRVFRRSLFIIEDIKKGETFTTNNIASIRPGYGLLPKYFSEVIGKKAKKNLKRGTPLSWQLVDRTD